MNQSAQRQPTALRLLQRAVDVERREAKIVLVSFAYFFCLLCAYYVLRPVRDAMGIVGGVRNLQWLFTGTFLAMLVAVPIYGAICSRFRKSQFLPWVYLFFIANILIFYVAFQALPDQVWAARAFFVWVSVFNLFIVSVFWSFMADIYSKAQGKRLFGLIAAGGSAGGLAGPLLTALLAERVGVANLLLSSALLLLAAVGLIRLLLRLSEAWLGGRGGEGKKGKGGIGEEPPIDGNPFGGFTLVFQSPYLLGICLFLFLYTWVATFVYFQQAELISGAFASTEERSQVFAWIDFAVNFLAIFTQLFLTGRMAKRFGVPLTLALLPIFMVLGFFALSAYPLLWVLIGVQVARRAGNYAITRPVREMLWTVVDTETKYKAKNFVDTAVYRGGDALSGFAYAGLAGLGLTIGGLALVGGAIAAVWLVVGLAIGRLCERAEPAEPAQRQRRSCKPNGMHG